MLEPPALDEAALYAALNAGYGLLAPRVTFLPLGQDSSAWVYRVDAAGGRAYFLKLRANAVNPAALAVPRYLFEHGVAQVAAPLPTLGAALTRPFDRFSLILYPFIEGARPLELTDPPEAWQAFGRLLRQIHTTPLPDDLARLIQRDAFTPASHDRVLSQDAHISAGGPSGPFERELAEIWREHQAEIRAVVAQAAVLAPRLRQSPPGSLVLCHADPHDSNVLVDDQGRLWLVDWDEIGLSLKERDLMFVIDGLTPAWPTPAGAARFFEGYGAANVDPTALAYYRADWAAQDIADFARRVLAMPAAGRETKREAIEFFKSLFEPGCIVDLALRSNA